MRSPLTTLCYVEKDDSYLMLHRVSKKHDVNKDKWIGIGGHFEEGESPEECLLREAMEEVAPILEKLETAEPAERTQLERSLNKKLGRLQQQSGNPLRDQMAEFEQTAGSLFEALRGIPAEFSAMLRGGDQGGNGE